MKLEITVAERQERCDRLLEHLQERGLAGVTLFGRDYILYYAGFDFIPTERPIAFVMNGAGERALFVPRLELEHARGEADVERVAHYDEYPDKVHPLQQMAALLADMGVQGETGGDGDGYPWIFGYRGPALSDVADVVLRDLRPFIEDSMAVKSPAEMNYIRESCRWGNLAHQLLKDYTRLGASETEVGM